MFKILIIKGQYEDVLAKVLESASAFAREMEAYKPSIDENMGEPRKMRLILNSYQDTIDEFRYQVDRTQQFLSS